MQLCWDLLMSLCLAVETVWICSSDYLWQLWASRNCSSRVSTEELFCMCVGPEMTHRYMSEWQQFSSMMFCNLLETPFRWIVIHCLFHFRWDQWLVENTATVVQMSLKDTTPVHFLQLFSEPLSPGMLLMQTAGSQGADGEHVTECLVPKQACYM